MVRIFISFIVIIPKPVTPGRQRACCGRILVNLTYLTDRNPDFLRLLPILPLAYTSCIRLPTATEAEESTLLGWLRSERGGETYIYADDNTDAALESDSTVGRLLYLRALLKILDLSGVRSLDDLPSLTNDPLIQHYLRQSTSLDVIEKIVRSTINRHTLDGAQTAERYVERGELMRARWKFLATVELALAAVEFEGNPWFRERWKKTVEGAYPRSFGALQRASQVCAELKRDYECEVFDEAIRKDPRYSVMWAALKKDGIEIIGDRGFTVRKWGNQDAPSRWVAS